jgi:hypothetical protein
MPLIVKFILSYVGYNNFPKICLKIVINGVGLPRSMAYIWEIFECVIKMSMHTWAHRNIPCNN